tara:strand:+ start:2878 stop:3831 length:954 start_codon:yes stop_codon:yes gene_type:complete
MIVRKMWSRFNEKISPKLCNKIHIKEDIKIPIDRSVIAIIGAPRIGSTLAYQILANSTDSYYMSNLFHLFHYNPQLAHNLENYFNSSNFNSKFNSNRGFENNILAPSEANYFWKNWFDFSINEFAKFKTRKNFLTGCYILEQILKKRYTLLSGWNAHLYYTKEMTNIFKNHLFINIKRDHFSIIKSIYLSRIAIYNDPKHWWSLKPKEMRFIKNDDPFTQISLQVLYTERKIEKLFKDKKINLIRYDYDFICHKPNSFLESVVTTSKQKNILLNQKVVKLKQFQPSKIKKSDALYKSIKKGYDSALRIYNKYDKKNS